jgi:2-methylisocitrate lyase-like PEP mutase family enzyme
MRQRRPMPILFADRPTWKETLKREKFLPLPVAHDALTAKLIERVGFKAYQIGGFALSGARHGWPDIDLAHLAEESSAAAEIVAACSLPVLVDCDDGYGDVKNVTHAMHVYQYLGASAAFIEDQKAPKKCGHMAKKEVVSKEIMIAKLRAAVAARFDPERFFLLARTDALQPEGMDEVLRRGEAYLKAGADGFYVDGVETEKELEKIGREFKHVPLATSVLEQGGKTPFLPFKQFHEMGYSMVLYATTLLFRVVRSLERALEDLKEGRETPKGEAVDMKTFEQIVEFDYWQEIEREFGTGHE